MARPGKMARPGCWSICDRPSLLSILPHDGAGGGMPNPRKLSAASARMAPPTPMLAIINIGAATLGRTWVRIIALRVQPVALAASRYSLPLMDRVAARMTRELAAQDAMAKAKIRLSVPGPKRAMMVNIMIR